MIKIKHILTVLSLSLLFAGRLYAQWTEADSVWLQGVISGKTELRLKPEVKKAIEEDRLINHGEDRGDSNLSDELIYDSKQLSSSSKYPLVIDFNRFLRVTRLDDPAKASELINLKSVNYRVNPFSSPPTIARTAPDPISQITPASHRVYFMINLTEILNYLSSIAKEK